MKLSFFISSFTLMVPYICFPVLLAVKFIPSRTVNKSDFNLPIPKVNQPMRIALVGSTVSPSLGLTLELFGKEKSLERIKKAIEFID